MNTTLETIEAETKAKLEGIALAAANTPDFQGKVRVLIEAIPKGNTFTIAKLRKECDKMGVVNPGSPGAWGAAMLHAAKAGLIQKLQGQFVPSSYPGCHRRPVQVWERI